MMMESLDEVATQAGFAELVGVSQQAISDHAARYNLTPGASYRRWLIEYTQRLRDEAAGRGGDDAKLLSRARAEEAIVKTANLRLDYNVKLGTLIIAEDAANVIQDWCRFANREYAQAVTNVVSEIQSAHSVKVPREMVDGIVTPALDRIQSHAQKLGRDLVDRVDDVHQAEGDADRTVAVGELLPAAH